MIRMSDRSAASKIKPVAGKTDALWLYSQTADRSKMKCNTRTRKKPAGVFLFKIKYVDRTDMPRSAPERKQKGRDE